VGSKSQEDRRFDASQLPNKVLAKTASSVASLPVLLFILMTVAAYDGFVGISVTHALSSE
jgi:hypothetical protein